MNKGQSSTSSRPGLTRPTTESALVSPGSNSASHSARWLLLGLIGFTLLLNGGAYYWFRLRNAESPPPTVSRDLALGTFEYSRFDPSENRFQRGQFDLSLRIIENLSPAHAGQLEHQEQRLQQAVEDTLRHMRAVDFTEPHLIRLRNRIEQRLNDELGFDWIEEVEISNQLVERLRPEKPSEPRGQTARPDSSTGG